MARLAQARNAARRHQRAISALLATTVLWLPSEALAQVAPADAQSSVLTARNGVQVVNIATPNASGLSHNSFTDFNVDQRGLVLNNGNSQSATYQSQLAGEIRANPNLSGNSANLILNEVTSTNRSTLNGFLEVAGTRADVVVANPNGITCGGCGFINAPNVTLTTGKPQLDTAGRLAILKINGGDILITGNGANGSGQQYLSLVARRISLTGNVNGQAVDFVAGTGGWDFINRKMTGAQASDAAPTIAIDSSVLGGMYANKIRLISTEQGAGVRMAGDMAASAGDFTIDAAGRVEILGKVSAGGKVAIQTSGNALSVGETQITAGQALTLGASAGTVSFNGGTLTAATDLSVTAASLLDEASASTLVDANKRYGGSSTSLLIAGDAKLAGTNWVSAGAINVAVGSLSADRATLYGSLATLNARSGALALGSTAVTSSGAISLSAAGALSASGSVVSTGGYINLNAGSLLQQGTISANIGAITVAVRDNAAIAGLIQAGSTLTLGGGAFTNSGTLLARGNLSADIQALGNSGIVDTGTLNATIATSAQNSGTITAHGDGHISAGALANTGRLGTAGAFGLTLGADSSNDGSINADGVLTIDGAAAPITLTNASTGAITSGVGINLGVSGGVSLVNQGQIAADKLQASLAQLSNAGSIRAGSASNIALSGSASNSGSLLSGGSMLITGTGGGATFTNSSTGLLQAGALSIVSTPDPSGLGIANQGAIRGSTVDLAVGDISNAGTLGAVNGLTIDSGAIANSGTLSGGAVDLTATSLSNAGVLAAANGVKITSAGGVTNDGSIQSGSSLSLLAGGTLTSGGVIESGQDLSISSGSTATNSGLIRANRDMTVASSDGLDNSGTVQADGAVSLTVAGELSNGGVTYAGTNLSVSAGEISNSATGSMQGTAGTNLQASALVNAGRIVAAGTSNGSGIIRAGTIVNTGAIQSAGNLGVTLGQSLDNSGTLLAVGDLALAQSSGPSITITSSGDHAVLQAGGTLAIGPASGSSTVSLNNGAGAAMIGRDVALNLGSFSNQGAIQGTSSLRLLTAASASNSGALLSLGTLSLSGANFINSGSIQSDGLSSLTATGTIDNSGTINGRAASDFAITAQTFRNRNNGILSAQHGLTIAGAIVDNAGTLLSSGSLSMQARPGSNLIFFNRGTGAVGVSGNVTIGTSASPADVVTELGSKLVSGGDTAIAATTFDNAGLLQADGALTLLADRVINRGTLLANGNLATTAATSIDNRSTGVIQGRAAVLSAPQFTNAGTLNLSTDRGTNGTIIADNLTINTGGRVQSQGDLTLTLGTKLYSAGSILGGDQILIQKSGASPLGINLDDGSVLQSSADFTLNLADTDLLLGSGATLAANSIDLHVMSLGNRGTIQGVGAVDIDLGSGTFTNSGAVYGGGTTTINAGKLTIGSSGAIQGVQGLTISGTDFDNAGTLIGGREASATDAAVSGDTMVTATTIHNAGLIRATGGTTVIGATSFANDGTIFAKGNVNVGFAQGTSGATITNGATGVIRGATIFTSGTDNLVNNGTIRGDNFGLYLTSLDNSGVIQEDVGSTYSQILATNILNRTNGVIQLLSDPGYSFTSGLFFKNLTNQGSIQSYGTLKMQMYSGGLVDNQKDAQIVSTGGLNLTNYASGSGSRITNNGLIQANGQLTIGGATSRIGTISLGSTDEGKIFANTGSIFAGTLNIGSTAASRSTGITSTGALSVDATALNMNNTGSSLVLGDGSTINTGAIVNPGMIFGSGDLGITATSITNTSGGGMGATGKLTANSGTGDFNNYGSIFGGSLDLTTSATFHNYSRDIPGANGMIQAEDLLNITAITLINNNIIKLGSSTGSMTLKAWQFRNEVTGGDTRTWNYDGTAFEPGASYSSTAAFGSNTSAAYGSTWATSSGAAYDISTAGTCGTTLGIPNVCLGATGVDWTATFKTRQSYGDDTKPAWKPQIQSNGSMTLDANQLANLGGTISANSLTIKGGSLLNDALAINEQSWKATWTQVTTSTRPSYTINYSKSVTSTTPLDSVGASIYANTLTVGSSIVDNNGNPYAPSRPTSSASVTLSTPSLGTGNSLRPGASDTATTGSVTTSTLTGLTGPVAGGSVQASVGTLGPIGGANLSTISAPSTGAVSPVTPAPVTITPVTFITTSTGPALRFGTVTVSLPTSPNSLFVISTNPSATYLVEQNPLFTSITGVSSDTIAKELGLDINTLQRRLGDGAYETFLITQQIVAQTGTASITHKESDAQQAARLMTQAVDTARSLGLVYGQALTPQQVAGLKQDIVWMVDTVVDGKHVLAPVVYLSAGTRGKFDAGDAVIGGNNASFASDSVTNNGGTITGTKSLVMRTTGDITNTSGQISGGKVDLTSTAGSIKNQTLTFVSGGETNVATVVGKTGGITATQSLSLDAAKDIVINGANVTSAGPASLVAGKSITIGTIDNKSTSGAQGGTTTTIQQLGSNIAIAGDLKLKSGGDSTIQGSTVKVGGNLGVSTGGDFNILAGQNSTETTTKSATSGMGVGGGLYGTSTTTTNSFSGRNLASNLSVGGNLDVTSKGAATIQGSDVKVAGNATVDADAIRILQGNDVDRSTSVTNTTTYLRVSDSGSSSSSTRADANAKTVGNLATASAGAGASTGHVANGDLELMNNTVTTTSKSRVTAVGSSFTVGGNTSLNANKDVTVQGSSIAGAGDVSLSGKDVNLLAAQNSNVEKTTTESTSVGLMAKSNNSVSANADAHANASVLSNADATAGAAANSDSTLDLYRTSTNSTTTTDITHTGASISSGGSTSLKASNAVNVQGSSVAAAGNVDVSGKTITFGAVNDLHETTTSSSQTSTGLYATGTANANANAKADVIGAQASAGVAVEGSIGLNATHSSASSVVGSTTAVTSSIRAGGNVTRTASGQISDTGTQIAAGGDFNQTAGSYVDTAARDTTYSASSSQSDNARVGAYVGADAGVTAGAGAGGGTGGSTSASAGAKASYTHSSSTDQSATSTARVSTITVGGNANLSSAGKTSLEGTQINAGKDVNLTASKLDYTAAQNTQTSSSTSTNADGSLKAGIDATKAVRVEGAANYSGAQSESAASQAVVGGITAGGNLSVKTTQGDANFEGTRLAAGGSASIDSAGSVNITAARDTSYTSSNNQTASLNVSTDKSARGGVDVSGEVSHTMESSTTAVAGSVTAGQGLTINAKKDVALEGTQTTGAGGTSITAGGAVTRTEAKNTSASDGFSVGLSASAEKSHSGDGAPASGAGTRPASTTPSAATTRSPASTAPAHQASAPGMSSAPATTSREVASTATPVPAPPRPSEPASAAAAEAAPAMANGTGKVAEPANAPSTSSTMPTMTADTAPVVQQPTKEAGPAPAAEPAAARLADAGPSTNAAAPTPSGARPVNAESAPKQVAEATPTSATSAEPTTNTKVDSNAGSAAAEPITNTSSVTGGLASTAVRSASEPSAAVPAAPAPSRDVTRVATVGEPASAVAALGTGTSNGASLVTDRADPAPSSLGTAKLADVGVASKAGEPPASATVGTPAAIPASSAKAPTETTSGATKGGADLPHVQLADAAPVGANQAPATTVRSEPVRVAEDHNVAVKTNAEAGAPSASEPSTPTVTSPVSDAEGKTIASANPVPDAPAFDAKAPASTPAPSGEAVPVFKPTGRVAEPLTGKALADAEAAAKITARLPEDIAKLEEAQKPQLALIAQDLAAKTAPTATPAEKAKAQRIADAKRAAIARPVLREMLKLAPKAKEEADEVANAIADQFKGKVSAPGVKSEERAMEKIISDYAGDATQMKDLARNTIIVDAKNIDAAMAMLRAKGAFVKVTKREGEAGSNPDATLVTKIDETGYTGINATFVTKTGLTAEIQINSPEMIFAKEKPEDARAILGTDVWNRINAKVNPAGTAEKDIVKGGLGHTIYEEIRSLPKGDKATAADKARAAELIQQSRDYYAKFQPAPVPDAPAFDAKAGRCVNIACQSAPTSGYRQHVDARDPR